MPRFLRSFVYFLVCFGTIATGMISGVFAVAWVFQITPEPWCWVTATATGVVFIALVLSLVIEFALNYTSKPQ